MRKISVKSFWIWTSGPGDVLSRALGGLFVGYSVTFCAILVECIKRNNSVKYFLIFGPVVQEEMWFIDFFIWSSFSPFAQQNGTICAILVEGVMRNNSVKLFWIWASVSGGDVVLKISYLELWQPSCSLEPNLLCNFERGHHWEHYCVVIWNLDQWFRRRCCFKIKVYGKTRDGRQTKTDHNSFPWAFGSGELKRNKKRNLKLAK